jgi:predicted PurR-regulated permease PerM
LAVVIALLAMILPAVYFVSELVDQVSGAYQTIQSDWSKQIGDYLSGLTNGRVDFQAMLDSTLEQVRQSIVSLAPNVLGSISELLLGLFIMFFVMFYGFREGQSFISYLKKHLPLEPTLKDSLFDEMRTITQAVLYGQVLTAVIQGGLGGLALLVFGVPNALFWGAIMIITAFLPVLGTPVIWVPAGVGLILDGAVTRGILLLVFGATVVMNIDNFLRPRLVSSRTNVHPVLILIGVLGGLKVFGFIGMLVGPLILAVLVALIKFYEQNYMREKQPQSVG